MLAYAIRRVFQSIVVLLVVGLVAFSMFRFVGDPIENLLGQERTDADIERLRADVKALSEDLQSVLGKNAEAFGERARARARQAQEAAGEMRDRVAEEVADRPFVSLGVAFVVGLVFGRLLSR